MAEDDTTTPVPNFWILAGIAVIVGYILIKDFAKSLDQLLGG